MTDIDRDDLDWMWHSVQLARTRLDKLPANAERWLVRRLGYEVRVREFVMAHLYMDLDGHAAVWRRYMVGHARLQQDRYANRISEGEFGAAARVLRQERDRVDAQMVGVPWLIIGQKEFM